MSKQPIDSYIFDMDGTLWDAVDSYCAVWDATARRLGYDRRPVTRAELLSHMGKPLGEIYGEVMAGCNIDRERFLAELEASERELMPKLGGVLYDGVADTLPRLASRAKLFMISNCAAGGLDNFLDYTGLKPYITNWLSYGDTGVDKDVNIKVLIERYNLKRPVYVGDVARDCESTHAAGIEFVHAAYGFGVAPEADFVIGKFSELEKI